MSPEIELFDRGNVLVTNKSFYVSHRSFPLQSISDVEVIYHPRTWMPVVAPLFAALSFELAAVSMHKSGLYIGVLVFMLVTAAAFWKGGLRYTIALETLAGHIRPMTSADRFMVESLSQVLGSAVRRAHQEAPEKAALLHIAVPSLRVLPGKGERTAAQEATMHEVAKALGTTTSARPILVAKKPAQSVLPKQVPSYGVKRQGLRKLAVASS